MDDLATAVSEVALELKHLGLNEALTSMGALELLAMEVKNGGRDISEALSGGLSEVAEAITKLADAVDNAVDDSHSS